MTYKETIDFLYSQLPVYHRIGKAAYRANLDNTLALDNYFDHPHLKFRSVHIAGTNGKGSVSHMLASVFQEAGWKTGLYTSPHLKDYRERIRINGEMIPSEKVIAFVSDNIGIINDLKPSFFEMSVAMAFDYFAHEKVDIAVIETGLGGRLDSTNIIEPLLSVITNIGYDHMDLLGDTLGKIATEKAGIIKKNIPVVIGETQSETKEIFQNMASDSGSRIVFADKLYSCMLGDPDFISGQRRYMLTSNETGKVLAGKSALGGDYQARNIPVVAAAAGILKDAFSLTGTHIEIGIENVVRNTGLMGRWQILGSRPAIICDTGHNKEGLSYVLTQLAGMKASKIHMVIGFVSDKDLRLVLPLFPTDAAYYFTKAAVPRALDHNVLRVQAAEYGLRGEAFEKISDALGAAKERANAGDIIFIGGSTFVVAEVL
jgi:dihydrofolate synthase / folylpolyglutamate synthase